MHRVIAIVAGMGVFFIPSPFARLVGAVVGTWTGWLALFGNSIRLRGSREMLAEGESKLKRGKTANESVGCRYRNRNVH